MDADENSAGVGADRPSIPSRDAVPPRGGLRKWLLHAARKEKDVPPHPKQTNAHYGATLEDAARSEGLHPATVYRWMRSKREFRDQIERAQGDFITQNLRHMNVAATRGSWQASAWRAPRRGPDVTGPSYRRPAGRPSGFFGGGAG